MSHVSRPPAVGVIGNPRSHAYKHDRAALDGLAVRYPGLLLAQPGSQAALLEALRGFHRDGVGLLVIHGGDGTLRDVLSALPRSYPGSPPQLALMPAGNTNLAAWSVGGIGTLPRLLDAASSGRLRHTLCPVLEVSWIGQPDRPRLRGLLFGAAAFAAGKRIADAEIHRRGVFLRYAVGLTLGLAFLRSLSGRGVLRQGVAMGVGVDQGAVRRGQHFLFLATTLPRLTLGLWPFWGEGEGGIHWLDIDTPPSRLARALVATLLRRPRPWMAAHGYRSGHATSIGLSELREFVLDGEFFDAGPAGVALSCADAVTFVRP